MFGWKRGAGMAHEDVVGMFSGRNEGRLTADGGTIRPLTTLSAAASSCSICGCTLSGSWGTACAMIS